MDSKRRLLVQDAYQLTWALILALLLILMSSKAVQASPMVVSTVPVDGVSDADPNSAIYIVFDVELDSSSITPDTIFIQDASNAKVSVLGMHYDTVNKSVVIIPAASLKENSSYLVTVTTGVKDLTGMPLAETYSWSFTTASYFTGTVPEVVFVFPLPDEKGVGLNQKITARFNLDIDEQTLNSGSFLLKDDSQQPVAAQSITYDSQTKTVEFVPSTALNPNVKYQATLTSAIKDTLNNPLAEDFNWFFTTGTESFASPHGNYTANISACKSCHQTHTAEGKALLKKSTQTQVCYTCHDGTGSSFDVKEALAQTGTGMTYHPIMNTGNSLIYPLMQCTDCHNPHGDKNSLGEYYPRLLNVTDGLNTNNQGNEFCLTCHGQTNLQLTESYYNDTAGDHTCTFSAHYDLAKSSLLPESGTQITCIQCHDQHAGLNERLLNQAEEGVCFTCHNDSVNSLSSRNIEAEFQMFSRHDIFSQTGAKVECSSCHGPHSTGAAKLSDSMPYSDLSDPLNTKKTFTVIDNTPNASTGTMTDFCLVCHSGSPPTATLSSTFFVPYTIQFPFINFTTNNGNGGNGWDKSTYKDSVHFLKGMGCDDCHLSHGSPNPRLQARVEDTDQIDGECLSCHGGSPPPQYSSAPNVKTDLIQAGDGMTSPDRYRHPTLYTSGVHTDTEDYSMLSSSGIRHAECLDCHDPHNEQEASGTNFPPYAPNPLKNVTGVDVEYSGVTWENWESTKNWSFKKPIVYQYQLCYKCHSSYAWQNNPPTFTGSIQETDIPKEFNPNNPSYHAVAGDSKIQTYTDSLGVTRYYGAFTTNLDSAGQPWNAASRMFCEDCHSSGTSGLRGPHGSNYWYLLNNPWVPNIGAEGQAGTGTMGTDDHLCFVCHEFGFYANGQISGTDTLRSRFSSRNSYNLHSRHRDCGCTTCHVLVPHGYFREGLLALTSDPEPYNTGAWLEVINWKTPGNWAKSDCNHQIIEFGPNQGLSCGN